MRQAAESRNMMLLNNEVMMLKASTAAAQATRVRTVCVALKHHCDHCLQREDAQNLPLAVFDEAREHLSRLQKELAGFERSVQMARAPKQAQETKQNKYTYEEDLDDKEHAKKLMSWNKEVYEARVAKAFVEQRLVRSLYMQQVQQRSARIYQQHHDLVQTHQEMGEVFTTPYQRRKANFRATDQLLAREIEKTRPHFNDLDYLQPRLNNDNLARRGLPHGHTAVAQPASISDLTRSVQLPPLTSLMNPRNQMTSPLPEKDTLLPKSPRKKRAEDEVKTRCMYLPSLLKFIAVCFEEKRSSETTMQKEAGPIDVGTPSAPLVVPLKRIINDTLFREHGSSEICAEKFTQLRHSCTDEGHGMHPRVAVFRRMAGWDEGKTELDPVCEAACIALLSWLGIATLNPPEKDMRPLLRLKDVNRVLDNLHRVRLLPPRAREYFLDLAQEMRLPRSELPRGCEIPMVDADALVWRWIDAWGGWDELLFDFPGLPTGRAPASAPASAR